MSDAWDERKKALEEEYFLRKNREALEKMKHPASPVPRAGQCPECGIPLEPAVFHDLSVERCPRCAGAWLSAEQLTALAEEKPHSWFGRKFAKKEE